MLEYKGYLADPVYDSKRHVFSGSVASLSVRICFKGQSVSEMEKDFRQVIDSYLEDCENRGEEPERPHSGKVIVRMDGVLHSRAVIAARRAGKSLNEFMVSAIDAAVRTATR